MVFKRFKHSDTSISSHMQVILLKRKLEQKSKREVEKERREIWNIEGLLVFLNMVSMKNSFNRPRMTKKGEQYEERQWNLNGWFITMCHE